MSALSWAVARLSPAGVTPAGTDNGKRQRPLARITWLEHFIGYRRHCVACWRLLGEWITIFVQFEHCNLITTFTQRCTKQYRLYLHLVLMLYYEYKEDIYAVKIVGVLADLQRWATSGTPALRWRVERKCSTSGEALSIDDVANTWMLNIGELYWWYQIWQHGHEFDQRDQAEPQWPVSNPYYVRAASWLERPVASTGAFNPSAHSVDQAILIGPIWRKKKQKKNNTVFVVEIGMVPSVVECV